MQPPGESLFAPFAPILVGHAVVTLLLWLWARRLRAPPDDLPWSGTPWLPLASFALVVIGVVLATNALGAATHAVAHADAALKASLLAQHISDAMWVSVFFVVASGALDLITLVMCGVGTATALSRQRQVAR